VSPRTRACTIHQAALLDFVDGGERSPATLAALEHLDLCPRCRRELEDVALAITALRRLGADARTAVPRPVEAVWPRLRARVQARTAPRWQFRATLGALLTSAALVGIVVGGETWQTRPLGTVANDIPAYATYTDGRWATDVVHEKRLLDHSGQPVPADDPGDDTPAIDVGFLRWAGPDGLGALTPTIAKSVPSRAK